MDAPVMLSVLEQLEAAVESDDQVTKERLLIGVLALLPPDVALKLSRRFLEATLGVAACSNAERVTALRIMADAMDSSPKTPLAQLRRDADQLSLGPTAGPLLQEALDEFIQAGRAARDPLRLVSSVWRCLHACVGAEVEADDARRNSSAWAQEAVRREQSLHFVTETDHKQELADMRLSSQRRMADAGRWAKTRQTWLRVVNELRAAVH